VKRATDTRARREVVAQMLDYAAHMSAYWQAGRVAAEHRAACEAAGRDPAADLATFLGETADQEEWWRRVEANMASGRLRLVFVADRISKELRRIVEFLNEQMRPAEVLAVEIEQYLSPGGTRTLVPRLLGDTEKARGAKAVDAGAPKLTDEDWWAAFEAQNGASAREAASRVLAWFQERGCAHTVTQAQASVAVRVGLGGGKSVYPFFIRNTGNFELSLQYIRGVASFAPDEARLALAERFRALPGLGVQWTGKATAWPNFPVQRVLDETGWAAFTGFADAVLSELKDGAPADAA
jgi:hypothetical protein